MSESLVEELRRRAKWLFQHRPKVNLATVLYLNGLCIQVLSGTTTLWMDNKRIFRSTLCEPRKIFNRKACYKAVKIMRAEMVLDELADV
jgi:hypothetical protein